MSASSGTMHDILAVQKAAVADGGIPDLETRLDRLRRLRDMLTSHDAKIVAAEQQDFAGKSPTLIRMAEVLGTVSAVNFTLEHLPAWMDDVEIPMPAIPGQEDTRAWTRYQPVGVVGVVAPWNGPIILTCMPLAGILAAGNRAMIKPSEFAPHTAALLEEMVSATFDPAEVSVINGDLDTARAFVSLHFDHLLYTGSTKVAKLVMAQAAENLVPLTLELGGKSPVFIGRSADMAVTAKRLAFGKLFHGGQVCVTPDYLLVHESQAQALLDGLREATADMFPDGAQGADYSPIVNAHHFGRLQGLLEDARQRGAEIVRLDRGDETPEPTASLKFPFYALRGVTDDMQVMQEEIFGPIYPIVTYSSFPAALDYVRSRPRPLSAYYFGSDEDEQRRVIDSVRTGSVVVNDVVCQIFHEQIAFGGVGTSGFGRYRGYEGFKTFSNPVSVLSQTANDEAVAAIRPPYRPETDAFIDSLLHAPA